MLAPVPRLTRVNSGSKETVLLRDHKVLVYGLLVGRIRQLWRRVGRRRRRRSLSTPSRRASRYWLRQTRRVRNECEVWVTFVLQKLVHHNTRTTNIRTALRSACADTSQAPLIPSGATHLPPNHTQTQDQDPNKREPTAPVLSLLPSSPSSPIHHSHPSLPLP